MIDEFFDNIDVVLFDNMPVTWKTLALSKENGGGGAGGRSRLSKIPRPTVSQLFSCPDENLRTALHRSHGVKLSTITMADVLDEIKKLAVVRQSNNVNTLALMTAVQERDEPV